MTAPRIRFASGLYDRMQALYTGEVKPEGIDFEFEAVEWARNIFDRMAGEQAFDASELSMSELISRISAKQSPFVAIPVFPSKMFRHSFVWYNARSGIKGPRDLAGRRIGVPLYTMTAAVWMRGHLEEDFGVDLSGVRWVQGATNSAGSHGDPSVLPPVRPPNLEVNTSGKSLSDLLAEGGIDAVLGTHDPDSRKRDPDIRRLWPDFKRVEQGYYRRTGIFPIMHTVAIRREAYERDPFIATSLYEAFCKSKAIALDRMRHTGSARYMLPWMRAEIVETDALMGDDPWPYGLEPNRAALETLMRFMAAQGIIAAPFPIDDIFVPVASGLT